MKDNQNHSGNAANFEINESNFRNYLAVQIGFTDADAEELKGLASWAESIADELIHDFYEGQFKQPEFVRIIQNAGSNRERLSAAQKRYFLDWFKGMPNGDYLWGRQHIGSLHARIGVTPRWYISSYQNYYDLLYPMFRNKLRLRPGAANRAISAVGKLITFDQAIIMDTYVTGLTAQLEGTLGHLSSNTDDVAQAVDDLARGSQAQAQSVQDVSDSMNEIALGIDRVADAASRTAAVGEQMRDAAQEGADVVERLVGGIGNINETSGQISDRIGDLDLASEEIGRIVETIDAIAGETNLLALNAAIEAARAGEHGRGFAVVADEVRTLAESSRKETQAISDLVSRVRHSIELAVEAVQAGRAEARQGVQLATAAQASLSEVLSSVDATADQVQDIAANSQEMSAAVRSVVAEVESISAVVEEASAATEQLAATADNLAQIARGEGQSGPSSAQVIRIDRAA